MEKSVPKSRIYAGDGLDEESATGSIWTQDENDVAPGFFENDLDDPVTKALFARLAKEFGLDFQCR